MATLGFFYTVQGEATNDVDSEKILIGKHRTHGMMLPVERGVQRGTGKFLSVPARSLSAAILITGLVTAAVAQSNLPRYESAKGASVWSLDKSGALTWGGNLYCPIGAAIKPTAAHIKEAAAAGVKDLVIDMPLDSSDWNITIAELEMQNFRYFIRLEEGSPATRGFLIDPAGNRVSGVSEGRTFRFDLPESDTAVVVGADRVDGSVTQWDRIAAKDGVVSYTLKSASTESGRVVLVYPEGESHAQMDCWEGFDRYRDRLLTKLNRTKFGSGFRGLVNPIGGSTPLPQDDPLIVPTSDLYRFELAKFLDEKYRSLDTALRSWGIPASFNVLAPDSGSPGEFKSLVTFFDVARLVPLWRGQRGVSQFFDPVSNRLIPADSKRSAAWNDISEVIRRASVARYARLTASVRTAIDVPVAQEWHGWSPVTESNSLQLTGMAVTSDGGEFSDLIESGARAASTCLRWQTPGWLVASDIRLRDSQWSDAGPVVDDLLSLGMRGVFLRVESPDRWAAVKAQVDRLADNRFAADRPRALFFPENASEPAQAQRLPGGYWWLPSPASGNRIDLSSHYFAYRAEINGRNELYLWTDTPGRIKLFMLQPESMVVRNTDGSDPDPKKVKGGVELTLGLLPTVIQGTDEIPIPEPSLAETMRDYTVINERNKTLKRDVTEELSAFRNAQAGMERNPSGSYSMLRTVLRAASLKVGDTTWIEGEFSNDNTFSDTALIGGCSNGKALQLAPRLPNDRGFYASYDLSVRYLEIQDVWVAARIPTEARAGVTITIGGQTLALPEQPTGFYGQGFAWYKLGTTRLAGNTARLRLSVAGAIGKDIAIDAIVLTPELFTPRGLTLPPVSPLKASPGKGSGGL